MDSKSSLFSTGIAAYALVVGLSLWGGAVSYLSKTKVIKPREAIAHLMSAAFAGLLVGLLCEFLAVPMFLGYVLCGIASHMGTPAIIKILMKVPVIRQFFGDEK